MLNIHKKKVVFLTLDITLVGGVERMLSTLTPYFSEANEFQVEIVSIFNSKNSNKFYIPNVSVNFKSNIKFSLDNKLKAIFSYFIILLSVLSLKRNSKTIYVSTFPNISLFFLLFKGSQNFIVSEHAQFNAHGKFLNYIRKILYKKSNCITLLTQNQFDVFSKFCNKDFLHIIPNPINKTALELIYKKSTIITVGRLVPEKGYNIFLKVIFEIKKKIPNIQVEILGNGPEKNNLLDSMNEYDLNSTVKIIENVTNVEQYLSKAKVFVVTSITESFGLAMLESLSNGIPVVAFDAGDGPKSLIIDNYNGYLVQFGDVKQLENKILDIYNSNDIEWDFLSKNAIKSSEKYYVQNIYSKWKLLINQ
jgi:glycosyltransferase involved in cell wall biosynthesis